MHATESDSNRWGGAEDMVSLLGSIVISEVQSSALKTDRIVEMTATGEHATAV